jgi:hypothetical protein
MEQASQDVVVTWGFVPDVQLSMVETMRSLGFEWVWLDGNRDAARTAFLARGDVSEQLLDVQMGKIAECLDLDVLKPRVVNPFDAHGSFRMVADVAADVVGREDG